MLQLNMAVVLSALLMSSVLWHSWLGNRKLIRSV